MKRVFQILFLLVSFKSFSQEEFGLNWIVGRGNSDKINYGTGSISTFDHNFNFYFDAGTSCISDSNGFFKLICNGYTLMDTLGNTIDNGDTLTPKKICIWEYGFSMYSQQSIIVPLDSGIYYVLNSTVSDSVFDNGWFGTLQVDYFDLLIYHKVDMNVNAGAGKVVRKGISLLIDKPLSRTQMMACRHADGRNWWLLKQSRDTNLVYKFIITKDSIYDMGVQGFNQPHWRNYDIAGQTMFSNDGKKYATTGSTGELFLADFDRCTGELTNPKILEPPYHLLHPSSPYVDSNISGLCFSPNGQFLYVLKFYNLYQFDLFDTDTTTQWYHVSNMDTTYDQFQQWATIYPSPDGKLVIGNWNGLGKAMSTINNPNVKGAGCGFCPKCLQFPLIGAGNPPCMPNYALGIDSSNLNCTPVAVPLLTIEGKQWEVYPNPTSSIFYFRNAERKIKELYNSIGQFLFSTTKNEMNVSYLSKGMYYLKCEGQTKKVIIE